MTRAVYLPDDERPPPTSRFAVRVAVLSGFALIVFTVIFFRLWYLEVLSAEEFLAAAQNNQVREIRVHAPRGEIVDREGRRLVGNRSSLVLQVRPDRLPERPRRRNRVLNELADVADLEPDRIRRRIRRQIEELPASPVILKDDIDLDLAFWLRERQARFPGVETETIFVRRYPNEQLAAHLLGHVSEVGPEQLEQPQYDELEPGDRIGQAGLEFQYNSALQGRAGAIRVPVDAFGRPRGRELARSEPRIGNNLQLTLDRKVQEAGERAIGQFGLPAAFVAMNVDDGSIVAMGSRPSFDPSIYTPPVEEETLAGLEEAPDQPLLNRATQGGYPTGSTFKGITAVAGLEEGLLTPSTPVADGGSFEHGGLQWRNVGGTGHGSVDMARALQVSSNVYFFRLGMRLDLERRGTLQRWSSRLGFGGLTGIDLPAEAPGILPGPEWRQEMIEQGVFASHEVWTEGHNMNLSVGQGDLSATPLQLATAYAAIGNGGQLVRPRLADRVTDARGRTVQEIRPEPRRELDISEQTRAAILEGLRRAAMEGGGTSFRTFGGFPVEVAGKTGSAERPFTADHSWYVALAPASNPEIVVATVIERGGFGGEAAAPASRDILAAYFDIRDREVDDVSGPQTVAD